MPRPTRPRWLLILAVGFGLLPAPAGVAQEGVQPEEQPAPVVVPPPAAPKHLNSPNSTLHTFVEAMDDLDYDRAIECLDLKLEGEETAGANADKLSGILNRVERIAYRRSPTADDIAAAEGRYAGIDEYVFFPRPEHRWVEYRADIGDHKIILAKAQDGTWRFSAKTVKGIADLYDLVSDDLDVLAGLADERERSRTLWLESQLPRALVTNKFLTLKYWQWIGLFVLILIGVVLDFGLRIILTIVSRRAIARKAGEARSETIRKMVRPFGLAAQALFWLWTIRLLDLPAEALMVVLPAARFFVMLAGVWAGFRVADLVGEVLASQAARTETKIDDLLVPLLRKTVKIFIFIFGLIYIADSLNIEIAPLLAGLGIGGIGFAFAARDTLENFFGSVTVIVDRPFQVGDWVVVGDVEGTVEDLGFRSTRIRTFYNSLVTIPNGNLVRATVDNYGRRRYRRWKTHLAITYDTPPDKIEAFCEGIRELIRLHPYARKDYYQVWLHQFGPSSLDVLVYMFYEAPDWTTELRERQRLMLDIIRLADLLGVEFAFPTETLHLYQESSDAKRSPAAAPAAGDDERAEREGRRAVHAVTAAAGWRTRQPEPFVFTAATPAQADDESQIESKKGGDA